MNEAVLLDRIDEDLMVITLNRPDRLNAINDAFIEGMHAALDVVVTDPNVRAVVLAGAGRAFCAGADLREAADLAQRTSAELYRGQQRLADMSVRLHELPVPVVAAVQGPAAGGGFALAAACDLRVASPSASFFAANVRIGVSGGEMGLSWLLPQILGRSRAVEALLSGRRIAAREAYDWGLVNRLIDSEGVREAAIELARTMTANPAFAVRLTKEMLRTTGTATSLREAVLLENRTQVLAVYAGDIDRATTGFRERVRSDT
jgi:enoyl-CoA hydratase